MYYILGKWPSFPVGKKRLKTSLGQEMYYVCLGRDRIKLDRVPISVTMIMEFLDFLSQGYKIGFVKAKFVGIFFFQKNCSFAWASMLMYALYFFFETIYYTGWICYRYYFQIQSCSVSGEIIDLTVTRGMLWSNNLFKSANIIMLCWTIASLS